MKVEQVSVRRVMKEIPERAASLHMRSVILWTNGNCMVFDDQGQQMPEYQGRFEVVAPRINVICRKSFRV